MDTLCREFKALVDVYEGEYHRSQSRADEHLAEIGNLWHDIDQQLVGRVLRCHLLAEHYLTKYLVAANPSLGDIESARLSFDQKLKLADGPRSLARLMIPGLSGLNKIRNRLAHRLSCTIDPSSIRHMTELVSALFAATQQKPPEGIVLIEEFTRVSSWCLAGLVASIRDRGGNSGLAGYNEWWDTSLLGARRKIEGEG